MNSVQYFRISYVCQMMSVGFGLGAPILKVWKESFRSIYINIFTLSTCGTKFPPLQMLDKFYYLFIYSIFFPVYKCKLVFYSKFCVSWHVLHFVCLVIDWFINCFHFQNYIFFERKQKFLKMSSKRVITD